MIIPEIVDLQSNLALHISKHNAIAKYVAKIRKKEQETTNNVNIFRKALTKTHKRQDGQKV